MIKIKTLLENNPVIPALKGEDNLKEAMKSPIEIVFVVMSNLTNIKKIVSSLKEKNKYVFVHIDMVSGLTSENYTVDYLMDEMAPTGIITRKHPIVAYAKKKKIPVIQRFFVLDSFSLKTSILNIRDNKPDAIEILPGIMPNIITRMSKLISTPIIASGLIDDKSDIINSINAGAIGVSTSKIELWKM